jgi:hypothetical protein
LTAFLDSDEGKFHGDLNAARNVNMPEYALNQSSLQMTLNRRLYRTARACMKRLFAVGTHAARCLGFRQADPPWEAASSFGNESQAIENA